VLQSLGVSFPVEGAPEGPKPVYQSPDAGNTPDVPSKPFGPDDQSSSVGGQNLRRAEREGGSILVPRVKQDALPGPATAPFNAVSFSTAIEIIPHNRGKRNPRPQTNRLTLSHLGRQDAPGTPSSTLSSGMPSPLPTPMTGATRGGEGGTGPPCAQDHDTPTQNFLREKWESPAAMRRVWAFTGQRKSLGMAATQRATIAQASSHARLKSFQAPGRQPRRVMLPKLRGRARPCTGRTRESEPSTSCKHCFLAVTTKKLQTPMFTGQNSL
jgi:hypothetical protein